MTEQEIRQLFEDWIPRLGLDNWVIRIDFEAFKPETSIMQIHRSSEYDRCIIKVNSWVSSGTPPPTWDGYVKGKVTDRDIEEAVVHELLHAQIGKLWKPMNVLEGECHRDAHDTACRMFDHVEEGIIDRLAVALVKAWDEP